MHTQDLFVYLHIPYCRNRCSYCDFITFENGKTVPVETYIQSVTEEIKNKASFFSSYQVKTVYFGGGTPSLIPAKHLATLLQTLREEFSFQKDPEITIEINPGTMTEKNLEIYQDASVNRFSLGVQTFNSWFIEKSGRKHSVEDSLHDLEWFKKEGLNFSLDLMFGLPEQNLSDLKGDVCQALLFDPPHVSLYNLTIPPQHELAKNRASEEEQAEMFSWIEQTLKKEDLEKYEISNFSKPDFFSRHNMAYWQGKPVIGFGISAHSYLDKSFAKDFQDCEEASYGIRFWNSYQMKEYLSQSCLKPLNTPFDNLKSRQFERLAVHESLTDFCYTRLRTKQGLSLAEAENTYPSDIFALLFSKLEHLEKNNWLKKNSHSFQLSPKGEILSNQVFLELTFCEKDITFLKTAR